MKKELLVWIILVVGCISFFGFNLGSLSYLKGDENYYFQSARRMISDHDWVTPRYHHHIRFEKPPFYYWLVAGSFKIFGVSWPVARFSSVLFGMLTALLVYLMARNFFGKKEALFSVLVLVSNELFFRYSRLCVSDVTLVFLITLSLFLFIKSYKTNRDSYFILSFIPMGLAVLTKGPVGLILVILITFVFGIRYRASRSVFRIKNLFLGILLFLAVTLPWFIAMINIHKEVFLEHIWSVELVNKVVFTPKIQKSLIESLWHYTRNFGYYIPVVLFSFLPWSIFLPFALLSKKVKKSEGRYFALSWFWVVFIFFSIAGFKHTHYMLALSPALAMIIGIYLVNFRKLAVTVGILSVMIFVSLTGFLLPTFDDGGLRVFSLKIASEIKHDEKLGMASGQFNIKKLGVHLNNLISSPYEKSGDDLAQYVRINKSDNLIPFLQSKKRVFVLITKTDYLKYVPTQLRRELYILERHLVWRKIKLNRNVLELILSGNLEQLKEEAYLVSNQR